MHLFLAKDLIDSVPNPDDDEKIELLKLPLNHALGFVHDGTIVDAKTIIGILLASNAVKPTL